MKPKPSLTLLCMLLTVFTSQLYAQTQTFSANGADAGTGLLQQFTVPAGITVIRITAFGGRGGNCTQYNINGGFGARAEACFTVNAGDQLTILVGKAGLPEIYSGGGGGGSFVTRGSFTPSNLLIAAGGGGGACYYAAGNASNVITPSSTVPVSPANGLAGSVSYNGWTGNGGTGGGNGGTISGTKSGGYGGGGATSTSAVVVASPNTYTLGAGGGGGGGFNGGSGGHTSGRPLGASFYYGGGGGGGGSFGGTRGSGGILLNTLSGNAGTSWINPAGFNTLFTPAVSTGNGMVIISWGPALPVTWLSAHAQLLQPGNVRIDWQVNETNCRDYIAERSVDGVRFSPTGSMNSKGDGSNTYTMYDEQVPDGTVYYRIKQTDRDGRVSYSAILQVTNSAGKQLLRIYPVPALNQLTIRYSGTAAMRAYIYTASGAVIRTITLYPGSVAIDISGLSAGIYWIKTADDMAISFVKN